MSRFAKFGLSLMVLVGLSATVWAASLKSGLQVGDGVPAFHVKNVTGQKCDGAAKDERAELCYRCKFSANPTVCVFTRQVNAPVSTLVKQLEAAVQKSENAKVRAFVVVLSGEAKKPTAELEKLATEEKIRNVPLTIFDDAAGPSDFQLAKDADVTVLMWNGNVKVNHAFRKGELENKHAEAIVADIAKIIN